jgi:hypothetical protein
MGFRRTVEIGAEFLVYAHHLVPSDPAYFPGCQTDLVKYAEAELRELGFGRKPIPKPIPK